VRAALLPALALLLAGCEPGPVEIRYGEDECAACRMRITDPRFASQLVMRTGKAYTFDAIECLIGFTEREGLAEEAIHSRWVADFAHPGRLIDVRSARWLHTPRVRSPMGLGVLAFSSEDELAQARAAFGGDELRWAELPALRRASGAQPAPGVRPSAPPQ